MASSHSSDGHPSLGPFLVERRHYAERLDELAAAGCGTAEGLRLLAELAAYNRINALAAVVAARHGWIGASFSCAEILTVLYAQAVLARPAGSAFRPPLVALGKGHAATLQYAALAGCGLLPVTDLLRYKTPDGPQAHTDRRTPGIVFNSGSLGQTLSKCCGLALTTDERVVALLGDGELQEGQCWEALMTLNQRRLSNLLVVVDRNGIQSDSAVADVKALPDLEGALAAFGLDVQVVDGQDLASLVRVFGGRTPPPRPTVIVADTQKGAGVSFMAARSCPRRGYAWHGRVPDDDEYARALAELALPIADRELRAALATTVDALRRPARPAPAARRTSSVEALDVATGAAFAEALLALAERRDDVVVLGADLEKPCRLTTFASRFPERYLEMGIAEQDLVSCAGGLALGGRLPVVNTYAAFLRRALEQIAVNASERTRIVYAGHYAGLCYTTDGLTHTSTADVAAWRSIPGMIVLYPACAAELGPLLDWYAASDLRRPLYLRLHRTPAPSVLEGPLPPFRLGEGRLLRDRAARTAVLTSGPHLSAFCCQAADALQSGHGQAVDVLSFTTLRPLDPGFVTTLARRYERLAVVEELLDAGGLLDELTHTLAAARAHEPDLPSPALFHRAADDFTSSTRDPLSLYARFGLDARSLHDWLASLPR